MASVYIVPRRIKDDPITGKQRHRYHVKMQLGRDFPIVHLGSWDTPAIAKEKRKTALLQLARGEMPTRTPALDYQPLNTTMERLAEAWLASRIDLDDSTKRTVGNDIAAINAQFGQRDPASLTIDELRAWIAEMYADGDGLMVGTIRKRFTHLRQILDHGEIDPNPARSRKLKFPKSDDGPKRLPKPSELAKLYAALEPDPTIKRTADRAKNIAPVRLMEQTGMRIHEVVAVRWRDWDPRRERLLVPKSKTNAGTRLIESISDQPFAAFTLPERPVGVPDDARVFPSVTIASVSAAMNKACARAKIHHYSPHDLRHLHLSRLLHYGILSPAPLASRAGHKSPDVTLKVYSHVIPPEDDDQAGAHDDAPRPLTIAASKSER